MGATAKLRKAAKKMVMVACASFSSTSPSLLHPPNSRGSAAASDPNYCSIPQIEDEDKDKADCSGIRDLTSKQNMCAICLEALGYSTEEGGGQAIFTAQCSHSFHFSCISCNVRHGSLTCPICRAHWTQLPRNIYPPPSALSGTQNDPVFRILDDSIASFRFHRRSFLRSARYDDDDPIDPHPPNDHPRLDVSLIPMSPTLLSYPCCFHHNPILSPSSSSSQQEDGQCRAAYLSVRLTNPQPIDLVLVASPNGQHLRLLKQSMALVAFSLRPVDRLAIVTYSSAAARVFPLRRMTSCGKRTALQVIDRLFYMGEADPSEGLRKGMKILEDRAYQNPHCTILHLSDNPTRSSYNGDMGVAVHGFQIGYGTGMRELEEFLGKVLGGVARDIQMRIGEEGKIVRVGELHGGEERRIILEMGENVEVRVVYSYVDERTRRRGETVVSLADKRHPKNHDDEMSDVIIPGRRSSGSRAVAEAWDYHHDPFMARRWAKRLHLHHAYRL